MIGETVSHYRILKKLGHGGMGVVYLAEDTHLGRRVAIKFSTAAPENETFRARFLREARAASALSHPHIARIYDYGESGGRPFLVMELVNGEDLTHVIARGGMSVLQAVRIVEEVAEALGEAHRNGIIHRDIKPGNIVIDERGLVKVLDFGLAKTFQEPTQTSENSPTIATSQTAAGTVLGTPSYMSPEQAREAPLAPRSDLFALGAVLYECLAGRPAFRGANGVEILAAVLHVDPPPPSQFNPRVPAALDAATMKALAKDPELRYQSAQDLVADLNAARASMTRAEGDETLLLPAPESRAARRTTTAWTTLQTLTGSLRRSRTASGLILVCLLAAIAAGWWLFSDRGYRPAPMVARWYETGVAALDDGTYYKASKALEQATAGDPQFSMAHARLAEAYLELDLTDKAHEEMLRAAPPGSNPPLTRAERSYLRALQLTMTGDFAAAAGVYRERIGRTPAEQLPAAYVDLGRAREKAEKTKEAGEAYRESIRRQQQNPAAWLHLAILEGRQLHQAEASQDFAHAEQLYRSLSNLEGVTEVLYQRAVIANRMANFKEARELLRQALEQSRNIGSNSQQILVLLQLSAAQYRSNDFAEAQENAAKALDMARANGLESLTARGLIDVGNAHFLKGDVEEAKKSYTQSLDYARRFHSEHNEARALFSLGSLAMRTGDIDQAIQNVKQALGWLERGGYQREAANALVLLARAQRQKGDFNAALQSFDQQRQLGDKLGDHGLAALALQGSGTVLTAQGRLPEASTAFSLAYDAARQTEDHLNTQYDLLDSADIYWRLGRYAEARRSLDLAGPSPSRDVATLGDQMRAAMALSQRDYAGAIQFSRQVLAQPNLGVDPTVMVKGTLGAAQMASGARREGLAAVAEAAQLAVKSGSPMLAADARLAEAEARLAAGESQTALESAGAAQKWYQSVGNQEAEWRAWLAAAAAQKALGRGGESQDTAAKAVQILAAVGQKWDAENYKTYLSRPDIQDRHNQLLKLAGSR